MSATTPVRYEFKPPRQVVPDVLYTVEELAERTGLSDRKVKEMIQEGLVCHKRKGFEGRWVLGADFIEFTKPVPAGSTN